MRYFNNITTKEELKKRFRELSITLHPDRGGNAEDFAAMMAEYENALKNLGAWTKTEAEHVAGLRRGTSVVFYGYAMNATYYTVERIEGERIHLVQVGRPCEGVEFFDLNETAEDVQSIIDDCATIIGQYDRIRPESQKFGIGWYWDDINGKTYTDEEITDARRRADNIKKYGAIAKAQREEAARKAKEEREAAEMIVINKWRKELKTIPADATDTKRKAIFKANIKAVFNHYFPGVKVSVSDSCKHYGWGKSGISWEDGPTVNEVEALEELRYFIASYSTVDITDYYETHVITSWQQWRDLFGVASGERYEFTRTLSESQKARITEALETMGAEWEGRDAEGKITRTTGTAVINSLQIDQFIKALGGQSGDKLTEKMYRYFFNLADCVGMDEERRHRARCYASTLEDVARDYMKVSKEAQQAQTEKENAPRFTPKHGETYRAIIKALGGNKFVCLTDGKAWDELTVLDPIEAAEALARGERVGLGKPWEYDGERKMSGVDAGGEMTHAKRRAKFAKVGFISPYIRQYHDVYFAEVSAETLEALRQDAADVEKQRKAWEEEQKNQSTKAEKQESTAEAGEILAEADGVTLTRSERGAEFSGNTYAHHAEIKTLGARWYRVGQVWTIKAEKIAEAVEMVNSWNDGEATTENEPQQAETAQAEPTPAEAEEPQQEQPQSEPAEAEETTQGGEMSEDLAGAFAQVFTMCADIFGTASTASAEEPQQESEPAPAEAETTNTTPEAEKGARIVFAASDTPELDEISTLSESAPGSSEHLPTLTEEERERVRRTFERGAREAETATEQNEHTRAIYLQGLALLFLFDGARALAVNDLLNVLQAIENRANERGHILPDEITARAEIADTLTACTVQAYGAELAAILWGSSQVARVNGKRRAA